MTGTIHCYDLSTGEYNPNTLVPRHQGFAKLPGDTKNAETITHIDNKFVKLERDTARIIELVKGDVDNGKSTVDLLREDLYTLFKFLFLLQLRTKKIYNTYFQKDHPNSVLLRDWIQRQKTLHNLPTDTYLWLNGLNYYLDTSTHQILEDADPGTFSETASIVADPNRGADPDTDVKYWHAQTYEAFHNWYYLSICEAALDSEFLLGDNSLGIWEGTIGAGGGQVHRLYIISPRIAIILRLNITRDPMFGTMMVDSILNDLPFEPPTTRHTTPVRAELRPSAYSPDDSFTFKIHLLTRFQTYKINEIVLENLREDGTLIFASEDRMFSTLALYDSPHGSFMKPRKEDLRRLKDVLSQRIQFRANATRRSKEGHNPPLAPTGTPAVPQRGSDNKGSNAMSDNHPSAQQNAHRSTATPAAQGSSAPEHILPESLPNAESQTRGETSASNASNTRPDPRTLLPETPADREFLRVLTQAMNENDEGGSFALRCLKVWKAATARKDINHAFALKIRCLLAEAIERCTSHPLGPWFPRYTTNKQSLDVVLSSKEYGCLFSLASLVIGIEYGITMPTSESESEEKKILTGAVLCGFMEWYSNEFCFWFLFQCIIHPMSQFPMSVSYVYASIFGKLGDNMRFTSLARASLYHFLQFLWCAWRLTHNANQVVTLILTCTSTFYRTRDFVLVLLLFQFCDWSLEDRFPYGTWVAVISAVLSLIEGIRELVKRKQQSQVSRLMVLHGVSRPETRRT